MHNEGTFSGGFSQPDAQGGQPCPACGSSDVARGVEFNQQVEVGSFGPVYKAAGIFKGTELLLADLCRSCGAVTPLPRQAHRPRLGREIGERAGRPNFEVTLGCR